MSANETLMTSSRSETINTARRTFIGGSVAAMLASSRRVMAGAESTPNSPFILLLTGIYQPVPIGQAPTNNLGLTVVNLNDGSYSKTKIYPIFGINGASDQKKAIGTFYVQLAGVCVLRTSLTAQSPCDSWPLLRAHPQGLTASSRFLTARVGITWKARSS